jgi:hydroxyethylthiazole kinase
MKEDYMVDSKKFHQTLENIRKDKPLIHHITNYVVANITANFTLAIGASPIMAASKDEVAEIASFADVLVLNIGTITTEQFKAMKIAAKAMKNRNKKIVLDPVGVALSKLRYNVVEYFIKEQLVDIVKGNYSEIMTLAGSKAKAKGVDSLEDDISLIDDNIAQLSRKHKCIFAATGEVDIISNGLKNIHLEGGNRIMKYITGTGCLATAAVGVFLSVAEAFNAAIYGLFLLKDATRNIEANGPAEFFNKFIDKIYNIYKLS